MNANTNSEKEPVKFSMFLAWLKTKATCDQLYLKAKIVLELQTDWNWHYNYFHAIKKKKQTKCKLASAVRLA